MPQTMCFGSALAELRAGRKVARLGWNGQGIWICLMPGYPDGIQANAATAKHFGEGIVRTRPYIAMRDAQGMMVTGWLASQTDLLAEDWIVVE